MSKTLYLVTLNDGNTEIIEDSAKPAFQLVWHIKSRLMLSLTLREEQEYEDVIPWIEKKEWIDSKVENFNF